MTEELRVCQDVVALDIAMTFSERFQKNYPKEDLFQMTNDLALAIEAYKSGLKGMGIKLMKKEDGFWLSFSTKDSSGVVVNLEQLFPFGVRRNVILRWAEEQIASTEKGESL